MNGFYEITTQLYNELIAAGIPVVTLGDYLKVDLSRQNPLPYAHIVPQISLVKENTVEYTFAIIAMDLVDFNKDSLRDEENTFNGTDNLQDVLNDIHNRLNLVVYQFRYGDQWDNLIHGDNDYTLDPFFKRFENLYAGWELNVTFEYPNTDIC